MKIDRNTELISDQTEHIAKLNFEMDQLRWEMKDVLALVRRAHRLMQHTCTIDMESMQGCAKCLLARLTEKQG